MDYATKIKPSKFPRVGAWAMVTCKDGSEALGIIQELGKHSIVSVDEEVPVRNEDGSATYVVQPVKKDHVDADAPFAEVHFVHTSDDEELGETQQHGHTATVSRNVPFESIRIAKYSEIKAVCEARNSPLTAERAALSGYVD